MKKILTILFVTISLSSFGQAGFRNGMLGLDTSFIITGAGLNNNVVIQSSLCLVSPTGNLTDTLTGLSIGQGFGALILVVNAHPTNRFIIKHNSSASDSINRILTADGFDYILPPFNTAIIGYDIVGSQWHIIRVPDAPISYARSTPSDPSTTTSSAGVMMGLAASVMPVKSGNLHIIISGDIDNNTAGDGASVRLRYGTGTAPTNGAALTGTTAGASASIVNPLLALLTPGSGNFTVQDIVTGLTIGQTYWIDVSLARITGGTARIRNVSIAIIEL